MSPLSRRELIKRASWLSAGLLASPAVLAACGRAGPSASTGPAAPPASASGSSGVVTGTTQVLVGFGTGNAPDQIPVQEELATAYAAARPGASIDYLRIPDTDEAQRKLGLLIAADDAPDLVLPTGLYGIALYLDQNVWQDLSGLMAAYGIGLELFHEATHRAARAVNYYGADSKAVVGLPAGIFTHAMAYNKELFAQAGIPEPPHKDDQADWTYERQLEIARALTVDTAGKSADMAGFDPSKVAQYGLGHWDTGMMIRGFGGSVYDAASRRMTIADDRYAQGLQFGADLINVHHVLANDELAAGVAAGADDPQLAAWRSGKIAMIDMCACDLLSFGVDTQFAWDVAQWPRGPERLVSHLNLDVGAIVQQSDGYDAAWQVLQFLLVDPANGARLSTESYGAMSPLKAETGTFVEELKPRFPDVDLQVFVDALDHSTPEQEEWFPAFTKVNDMFGQYLDAVYQGEAPAADQLPAYQEAAQQAVDDWFETHTVPPA